MWKNNSALTDQQLALEKDVVLESNFAAAGVTTEEHLAVVIVFASLFCMLLLLSIFLNVLFIIIYSRKPSLRNISNEFIVSLTISNLVAACSLFPLALLDLFPPDFSPEYSTILCATSNCVTDFVLSSSVFATVLIGLDRFFAITDPLHYHQVMTKCRSFILIFIGWTLAFLIGVASCMSDIQAGEWNVCKNTVIKYDGISVGSSAFSAVNFLFSFLLPFISLSLTYSKIYEAAHKNSERTRSSSLCTPGLDKIQDFAKNISRSPSTRSGSSQIVSTIKRRISNASLFLYKEEARAAKISVAVVLLFLICWLPYYVSRILSSVLGQNFLLKEFHHLAILLGLSNSVISPYIYIYRSKRLKREALRQLKITPRHKRKDIERCRRVAYPQLPYSVLLQKVPSGTLEAHFRLQQDDSSYKQRENIFSKIFHTRDYLSPESCKIRESLQAFSSSNSSITGHSVATSTTGSSLPGSMDCLNSDRNE